MLKLGDLILSHVIIIVKKKKKIRKKKKVLKMGNNMEVYKNEFKMNWPSKIGRRPSRKRGVPIKPPHSAAHL